MKTRPVILVFPVEADKDEVTNLNGNVYTQPELTDLLIEFEKNLDWDIQTYDLDDFVTAINEGELDVLTESWIAHVNVIEEEKP